jgi:hypothetical protein
MEGVPPRRCPYTILEEAAIVISLEAKSQLLPSRVIDRAVSFFGPGGWGLQVVERAECCARFEGGGGHVFVQASAGEKEKGSRVTVESVEWEHAARQFVSKLSAGSPSKERGTCSR